MNLATSCSCGFNLCVIIFGRSYRNWTLDISTTCWRGCFYSSWLSFPSEKSAGMLLMLLQHLGPIYWIWLLWMNCLKWFIACNYSLHCLLLKQSTVQSALDFLTPESLRESARMGQEIRCLPNHHDAKLKMLEVPHNWAGDPDQLLYAHHTYHLVQKRTLRVLSSHMQVGKISLYAASSAVR